MRMRALKKTLVFLSVIGSPLYCAQQSPVEPPGTTVVPTPHGNHVPTTRTIEGVVLDAKGAPIPGAIVLLRDTKTLQIRSYIAGRDGTYHFFGLNTDVNYELRAETNEMTSPSKLVSVFNSRKLVKLNLKVKDKKKPYSS